VVINTVLTGARPRPGIDPTGGMGLHRPNGHD
jgi:hypothetical protein